MPCCAFAAFLLSQLLIGVAAIERLLLGRRRGSDAPVSPINSVVEWRLGQAIAAPAGVAAGTGRRTSRWSPRRATGWVFALAVVLEMGVLLGLLYGVRAHFAPAAASTLNSGATSAICRSH